MDNQHHYLHSSYREQLIEHLMLGSLMKLSWLTRSPDLEVSKPHVDNSGYDVLLESNGVIRHVQLKTSALGSSTKKQKIQTKLMDKPSGCVVWIYFDDETLELGPFLFFGGEAGEPLPDISGLKVSRHTKGNAEGIKAERQAVRDVPKSSFEVITTLEDLWAKLFGQDIRRSVS